MVDALERAEQLGGGFAATPFADHDDLSRPSRVEVDRREQVGKAERMLSIEARKRRSTRFRALAYRCSSVSA